MERKSERFNCIAYANVNMTFYLKNPDSQVEKEFKIQVVDISETGMKFITDRLLAADECFYVSIKLDDEPIRVCCTVVRIAEINDNLVFGAKFVNLDIESQKQIKEYLSRVNKQNKSIKNKERKDKITNKKIDT